MIRRAFPIAAVLFVGFGLLAAGADHVGAGQSAPNTSCISGVSVEPLAKGQPSQAEGYDLVQLRVNFEPGGSIGLHTHPGSLTISVEKGAFGFTLQGGEQEGEMEVMRAAVDGTAVPAERLTPGRETILQPGDWVFEHGMVHSARNASDGPTSVLVAGLARTGEPFTQCIEDPVTSG